jgi:hypothetical protein
MSISRKLACAAVLIISMAFADAQPSLAKDQAVISTILINAAPQVVWSAIKDPRSGEAFHRRIVSSNIKGAVVEEKFAGIPVLGETTCLISEETEVPFKEIDFSLLRSDKLKQFKGSWTLLSSADGRQTNITLTTFCDSGIPFSRDITNATISKNQRLRLEDLKELAESVQR